MKLIAFLIMKDYYLDFSLTLIIFILFITLFFFSLENARLIVLIIKTQASEE